MSGSAGWTKRAIGWREIVVLLLVTLFLTVIWGRHLDLRVAHDSQRMTYIRWFNDRSLYQDSLLGMTNESLYSAYYVLLGLLGKVLPPLAVLYVMLFVTNLLAVFSVFWLACVVSRRRVVGYVAVILLLFHNPHSLGGAGTLIGNPTPGAFSISLCLLAVGLFLKRRYVAAFALLGVTANFYGSYAFYTAVAFGTYYLVAFRKMDKRIMATSILACAACAAPLVIWMLASGYSPGTGTLPFESWYTLVMDRSPGHVSPFSWSARTYLSFLPHLLFLFLWRPSECQTLTRDKLWAMTLGVFLLCAAGTVFVELIPIQQVIQLVLFRSTKLVMVFGIVAGATYLSDAWESRALARWIALFAAASLLLGRFDLLYPSLVLLYAERFLALRERLDLAMGCALIGLSVCAWMVFPFSADLQLLAGLLCVGTLALLSRFDIRWGKAIAASVVAATLVAMSPLGLYEKRGGISMEYYQSLKETQLWLAENTPPDRLIMTPPQTRMWSGFSERGVFLNYVDVAMLIYVPWLGCEVVRRVNEYVGDVFGVIERGEGLTTAMKRAYRSWDEETFLRIGDRYGCSVAVVEGSISLNLPLLYQNGYFRVYSVQQVESRNEEAAAMKRETCWDYVSHNSRDWGDG